MNFISLVCSLSPNALALLVLFGPVVVKSGGYSIVAVLCYALSPEGGLRQLGLVIVEGLGKPYGNIRIIETLLCV